MSHQSTGTPRRRRKNEIQVHHCNGGHRRTARWRRAAAPTRRPPRRRRARRRPSPPAARWQKLQAAQKITIGTKFDQPLFGHKGLDGKPEGFDVEIGKIIAAEIGIPADKIDWIATVSAIREELHRGGQGRRGGRDVHHQRRPQGAGRLRRAVLRGRPGHPGAQGRQLDHRPGLVQGRHQEGLLRDRLHPGQEDRGVREGQDHPDRAVRRLRQVRRGAEDQGRSTRSPPTTSSCSGTPTRTRPP